MKRRTLLKALLLSPIVPLAAYLRWPTRKPKTIQPDTLPVTSWGKLYVVTGDQHVGKTTLARAMAERHGLVMIDDVQDRLHPFEDCDRLVREGTNVIATVKCSSRVQDCCTYDAESPEEMLRLWMSADWMFNIDYRRNDGLFACRTVRDRSGQFPNAFVWTDRLDFTCLMASVIDADLCLKS